MHFFFSVKSDHADQTTDPRDMKLDQYIALYPTTQVRESNQHNGVNVAKHFTFWLITLILF